MHRESHLRVFKVLGEDFDANIMTQNGDIFTEAALKDLKLIDTSGYPRTSYS